ncbi:MAG: M20/M25/M40 family metallo-hydrolase [Trueperaceae bacterium]|nr:M20/M25/M40 family metallo-hydrolase [Trueperaceae bacterium]
MIADLEARYDDDVDALLTFVRIPSVSTDPSHAADVRAAAEHLAERLTVAGLDDAEVLETDGHPLVSAAWRRAPDAPTVLVYGHYDVQPPEPLARWTTPPFEPSVRDGRIYARGVSDDKAPLHRHRRRILPARTVRGGSHGLA